MASIYESSFNINSFHAVNKKTGAAYTPDATGFITLAAGDTVVFQAYNSNDYVYANTIVFTASSAAMKIQLNDNSKYPLYIPANEQRGVQYMKIYEFTALTAGQIYYDGLCS